MWSLFGFFLWSEDCILPDVVDNFKNKLRLFKRVEVSGEGGTFSCFC